MDSSISVISSITLLYTIMVWILILLFKKNSESRIRQDVFLQNIGDGVIALDKKLTITLFNKAATILTGYSSREAIGKPFQQIIKLLNEKNQSENITFIGEPLFFGKTSRIINNIFLITKSKSKLPIGVTSAPIVGTNGNIAGAIMVFRDNSQERELTRIKDEFISLASHELRTPMTAITGYTDMMLEGRYGPVTTELREPLKYIETSTDRLIRLVDDLLNVSRIETGHIKYSLENIDLKAIITQVLSQLRPIAEQKKIKLQLKTNRKNLVQADPEKVEQILNNLIGNAIKFTDKGHVTISFSKVRDLGVIKVSDTGIGISSKDQKKLFRKFQQISSSAGRPAGTGLGLFLSRQMAREMDGDVTLVKSKPKHGSIFALSLPTGY